MPEISESGYAGEGYLTQVSFDGEFLKKLFSQIYKLKFVSVLIANWGNTSFENCQFLSRHLLLKSYLLRILSVLNALLIIWSFSTSSLCLPSFKKQKSSIRQRNRANDIMHTHVSIRSISTYQHSTAIYSPMLFFLSISKQFFRYHHFTYKCFEMYWERAFYFCEGFMVYTCVKMNHLAYFRYVKLFYANNTAKKLTKWRFCTHIYLGIVCILWL